MGISTPPPGGHRAERETDGRSAQPRLPGPGPILAAHPWLSDRYHLRDVATQGGRHPERLTQGEDPDGHHDDVEIVVRDSGPGVDSGIAAEVFVHGFTTKAAREGNRGIGLALTRMVCRRRGGEVLIRSVSPSRETGAEFVARMAVERSDPVDSHAKMPVRSS